MKKDGQIIIVDKSFQFALRIVKLGQELRAKNEYVLSQQIIKSGTSIGANVEEAQGAESNKEFIHKMSIAYKEARETNYWLRIIVGSEYFSASQMDSILSESEEICKIISSIILTSKDK